MNRYYTYPGMEIWNGENWNLGLPMDNLAQWMGRMKESQAPESDIPRPADRIGVEPDRVEESEAAWWADLGMKIELRTIWISKWISVVPNTAVRNSGVLLPTVLCLHQDNLHDPAWATRTLGHYRELGREAAKQGRILVIVVTEGPDITRQYGNILMEATSLYPIDYDAVSLDVTPVYRNGHTLSELPGGVADGNGGILPDPDAAVENFGEGKLLDVSKLWRNQGSPNFGQLVGPEGHNAGNPSYDSTRFLHTLAAQRLVEPLELENRYAKHDAPELLAHWEKMGLCYEAHETNHERWITLTPRSVFDAPGRTIPIMLIFQEVYFSNDHLPIEAAAYWYEYVKIAAQGECMLLFYACECEEHNRFMKNIFLEACKKYPVDRTRVYVTGFSHNCGNAVRFAYDNPDLVTAVAGGAPGMSLMGMPPQQMIPALQRLAQIDMPCIHTMGCCEHMCPPGEPRFETSRHLAMLKHNAIIGGNCEPRSMEDFRLAYLSPDRATRMTGVPNDHSEVLYLEGVEHYIADVRNRNGKYHLRFVTVENTPHNPFPTLQILQWSYIRRFARDENTHEIIERY